MRRVALAAGFAEAERKFHDDPAVLARTHPDAAVAGERRFAPLADARIAP